MGEDQSDILPQRPVILKDQAESRLVDNRPVLEPYGIHQLFTLIGRLPALDGFEENRYAAVRGSQLVGLRLDGRPH